MFLIYHVYTAIIEQKIKQLARYNCTGCRFGDNNDFKSHQNGCIGDWDALTKTYFEEAKFSVNDCNIWEVFSRVCDECKLYKHPHMRNIITMLTQFGNITANVLETHTCPPLINYLINQAL